MQQPPLRLLPIQKKPAQVTYQWKKVEEGMASNSEEFTKVTYIFPFNYMGRYEEPSLSLRCLCFATLSLSFFSLFA